MHEIRYVIGDATRPEVQGNRFICHVCNDIGAWGKGFVLALSKRWKEPEARFREWHARKTDPPFELGQVQFVEVEPTLWVVNMIGQRGIRGGRNVTPIRYEAVADCLTKVARRAQELDASVHMPRIGCGLAGGEWPRIEAIILETLGVAGIAVTVYDSMKKTFRSP